MNQKDAAKSEQLGCNIHTAASRLRKALLFKLAQLAGVDVCFRCRKRIETVEDLTIDHKEPWLYSGQAFKLFMDTDNVAFSHYRCNVAVARKNRKPQEHHAQVRLEASRRHHRTRTPEQRAARREQNRKYMIGYNARKRAEKLGAPAGFKPT